MSTSKLVVAHRGYHAQAHENTLEAMQQAVAMGADMVEFDVRRCADGELIVHHDPDIHGQTLARMDFGEIQRVAEMWGYRVPRLTEVLQATAGRIGSDIELKEAGYEEAVLRLVSDVLGLEDFFITCFDPAVLASIRILRPEVRLGILTEGVSGAKALEIFEEIRADFLAPDSISLTEPVLAESERRQIPLLPWTVDDAAPIERYLEQDNVLGIVTNRPELALKLRNRPV